MSLAGVAVEGGLRILLVQGRSPPFVSTGVRASLCTNQGGGEHAYSDCGPER